MVKRTSLKKQSYNFLKSSILNDEVKTGVVYSEQQIADMLDISRTPVRESISQLAQEGYVEILPNRGFMVKRMSVVEMKELFQLRIAIEGYCCKYAAENIGTEEGMQLVKDLEQHIIDEKKIFLSQGTPQECMNEDTNFHLRIIDFADNKQFLSIMSGLRARVNHISVKSLYNVGRMAETLEDHRKIVDCIKREDGHNAYIAAENHFKGAEEAVLRNSILMK